MSYRSCFFASAPSLRLSALLCLALSFGCFSSGSGEVSPDASMPDSDVDAQRPDANSDRDANSGRDANISLREPLHHRPERRLPCDNERATPEVMGGDSACETHEDCTEGANGRCLMEPRFFSFYCSYDACFTDDDCTGPCTCGEDLTEAEIYNDGDANVCLSGGCQIDADCGPGGWCSPTFGECGSYAGVVAYECHTPEDECIDDIDCQDESSQSYCAYSVEVGHWACSGLQCVG